MISIEDIKKFAAERRFPFPIGDAPNLGTCLDAVVEFQNQSRSEMLLMKLDELKDTHDDFKIMARQFQVNVDEGKGAPDKLSYYEYKELSGTKTGQETSSDFFMFMQRQIIPRTVFEYLSPALYLSLPKDEDANIKTKHLLQYIQKSIDVEIVGLNLLRHCLLHIDDGSGWGVVGTSSDFGFITEAELERFVFEQIPYFTCCKDFDKGFYPFYVRRSLKFKMEGSFSLYWWCLVSCGVVH